MGHPARFCGEPSGTDAAKKTRLLAVLVEIFDGAGTDPNDIMMFFGEIDRASSSFGGGSRYR
jgi:hypothetical protein